MFFLQPWQIISQWNYASCSFDFILLILFHPPAFKTKCENCNPCFKQVLTNVSVPKKEKRLEIQETRNLVQDDCIRKRQSTKRYLNLEVLDYFSCNYCMTMEITGLQRSFQKLSYEVGKRIVITRRFCSKCFSKPTSANHFPWDQYLS